MAIVMFEEQGVVRLQMPELPGPDEAKEVSITEDSKGIYAELGGLRARVILEQAERLITAGARDHRTRQ
ncbi:hypothetical protein [Pseudomonas sp. DC3200b2]|uniref:hypothetical protein n=1 Tax=Pseudomonas sp. DC3200b2 TaxID=2804669 RepID=UPI003CF9DEAC